MPLQLVSLTSCCAAAAALSFPQFEFTGSSCWSASFQGNSVKGTQSGESCVRFESDGARVTWTLPCIHIRGGGNGTMGGGCSGAHSSSTAPHSCLAVLCLAVKEAASHEGAELACRVPVACCLLPPGVLFGERVVKYQDTIIFRDTANILE
jgi:hypothetical protein